MTRLRLVSDPVALQLSDVAIHDRFSSKRPRSASTRHPIVTLDGPGCIDHLGCRLHHPNQHPLINGKLVLR